MADPVAPNIVTVKSPDGDLGTMDQAHLASALQHGFTIPTNDEITQHNNQITYGEGFGNQAKAFGAAALRGATLGLSDQALTKTGIVNPETLRQLKEQNPETSLAGEVTGVVAPAVLSSGMSLAEYAPAALLGRAGAAATEAAAPLAKTAARIIANPETAPLAHRILSQAGAHALGSAVEGAGFGLGQSISEQALGDPSLNGEKVLSNVGLGALFGGALGGTLKAGEIAAPEILTTAKQALSKVYEPAKDVAENGLIKASSFISGKPESTIREVWDDRALSLHSPEAQQNLIKTASDDFQHQYETLSKASKTASTEIRSEETQALLNHSDAAPARLELQKTNAMVDEKIQAMRAQPELFPNNFPAKLEQYKVALNRGISDESGAGDIYAKLNEFKQNLDPVAKFGKRASLTEADAVNEFKALRNQVKQGLEDEGVWGEAGVRQSAYNDALNEHLFYKQQFEKSFMKKALTRTGGVTFKIDPSKVRSYFSNIKNLTGEERTEILQNYLGSSKNILDQIEQSYSTLPNREFDPSNLKNLIGKNSGLAEETAKQAEFNKSLNQLGAGGHNAYLGEAGAAFVAAHNPALGGAIEAFNMLRNPGLAIPRLAKIERMAQKTAQMVGRGVKSIFDFSNRAGEALSGYAGSKAADAVKMPQSNNNPQMPKVAKRPDEKYAMFNELGSNPQKLIDQLDEHTSALYHVAPKTAQSLQITAARATQFLASKVPNMPKTPLGTPYQPSQAEMSKFNKYLTTVEDPVSVLEHVKNGTLVSEHMETLSTVFPKLYADMQTQLIDQMTNHMSKKNKEMIPYRTRMALGMFLNQDLDGSTSGQIILSNQGALGGQAQAQNEADKQMKTSQAGLSKVTLATRNLTSAQSNAQRT